MKQPRLEKGPAARRIELFQHHPTQSAKSIQSPTGEPISRAFVVFLIQRDVKISTAAEFRQFAWRAGEGAYHTVRYQGCDSKTCFLPATVQWQLNVLPLDRLRAPAEIRHK